MGKKKGGKGYREISSASCKIVKCVTRKWFNIKNEGSLNDKVRKNKTKVKENEWHGENVNNIRDRTSKREWEESKKRGVNWRWKMREKGRDQFRSSTEAGIL